jgi:hypothetical protein
MVRAGIDRSFSMNHRRVWRARPSSRNFANTNSIGFQVHRQSGQQSAEAGGEMTASGKLSHSVQRPVSLLFMIAPSSGSQTLRRSLLPGLVIGMRIQLKLRHHKRLFRRNTSTTIRGRRPIQETRKRPGAPHQMLRDRRGPGRTERKLLRGCPLERQVYDTASLRHRFHRSQCGTQDFQLTGRIAWPSEHRPL